MIDRVVLLRTNEGKTSKETKMLTGVSIRSQQQWLGELGLLPDRPLERHAPGADPKKEKRSKKNDFSGIDLRSVKAPPLFQFQNEFLAAVDLKDVYVLKSRQLGYSYVVAWWALHDALTTGRNKIFLSASRRQVGVLFRYIKMFSKKQFNVQFVGQELAECITPDGETVSFVFCANNVSTAQGYNGDVIFDEFAWIEKSDELREVAEGMATHKQYRVLYITTASQMSTPAYRRWAGLDEYGKPQEDDLIRIKIDIHEGLKKGADALIDLEKLRTRTAESVFARLYECEWADDSASIFKSWNLRKCYYRHTRIVDEKKVEEICELPAYDPNAGNCTIGIDPNQGRITVGRDDVGIVVTQEVAGKLRVLEVHSERGLDNSGVMQKIIKLTQKYNPVRIAFDITGVGHGLNEVFKIKKSQFQGIRIDRIDYARKNIKRDLVQNMENLVSENNIEFAESQRLLFDSFLAIEHDITAANKHRYVANRRKGVGHADVFFALAHAAQGFQAANSHFKRSQSGGGCLAGWIPNQRQTICAKGKIPHPFFNETY